MTYEEEEISKVLHKNIIKVQLVGTGYGKFPEVQSNTNFLNLKVDGKFKPNTVNALRNLLDIPVFSLKELTPQLEQNLRAENESLKHIIHGFAFYLSRLDNTLESMSPTGSGLEAFLSHDSISDINDLYAAIETDGEERESIDDKYKQPVDWNKSFFGVGK